MAKETKKSKKAAAADTGNTQPSGDDANTSRQIVVHAQYIKDLSFENMKRAIIYGSAFASLTVEKFGTDNITYLKQEDLNARIDRFKALVQVDIKAID